jgi:hypothetical protein
MKVLSIAASLALIVGLLSAGTGFAAQDSSAASADVVAAIAIDNTVPLEFGQIVPSAVIGTVALNPTTAARSPLGGVTLSNGITPTAASFNVTGSANSTYAITLPSSILLTGAGVDLTVDTFTSDPTVAAGGTLSGLGAQALKVGAKVHLGVSQAAGEYSGTFDVSVAYN